MTIKKFDGCMFEFSLRVRDETNWLNPVSIKCQAQNTPIT